jgi:peptidyl-prolyl cis-trans isomerase D
MSQNIADQMKRAMVRDQFSMKKVVAFFLFGAIALVFVFTGYASRDAMGPGNVAQVNNTIISLTDLQREQQRIEQFYAQMFGGMDLGTQRQYLLQEAVQNLVNTELVSQAARREGMGATNQEVMDWITKDQPAFQENGVFQRDRYFRFIEARRFTVADFENLLRKETENIRARKVFEWASLNNQLESEKAEALKKMQVTLSYISVNPLEIEKSVKFSDAEVSAALAEPEFEKRAENEFKARKSQFDQKEQVKAQHILIRSQGAEGSEADTQALKRARSLRDQVLRGDFGAVAEKNSDDPGSKSKKGDLGYFSRGQMVPQFEDVAFKMKVGEISQPVKTQFGYHLIKLTDKKPAQEASFQAFKSNVAQILMARDLLGSQKNKLPELFAKGDEKPWLQKLNLNWKDSGTFDLGAEAIPGLGSQKVIDSLSEILAKPREAHFIQEGDVHYIVKLKDVRNAATSTDSKSSAEALQKVKAQNLFEAWVQSFRQTSKVEINPKILQTQP